MADPLLGRYQILKHLASGGMAELFLAKATGIEGFERYVVIKRILPNHARDERFVKMFLDEARLAAQLHHQHIGQVYDIGQEAGTYFFAMEYVHGENVRELLKKVALLRRQIPIEHTLAIVAATAAGLHYAHEKRGPDRLPLGVVHRDVSPSNVIVAYDGAVKVVDFGIAKAASRMSETRSGTLKGKIAYMSPEQCTGRAIDRRSDVFSLGIVLYELSTVTRLFKGENDYVTMNRIATGEITPPSQRRADFPIGLEPIIMKCLAVDAADRYQTAGELLEALEKYAATERIALSPLALGRFIRELFGERPEPWFELSGEQEDIEVVEVTSSQVDGSGDHGPSKATTPLPRAATAQSLRDPKRITAPGSQGSLVLATATANTAEVTRRKPWMWLVGALLVGAMAGGAYVIGSASNNRGERGGATQPVDPPAPGPAADPIAQPAPPVVPPPADIVPGPSVVPPATPDAGVPPTVIADPTDTPPAIQPGSSSRGSSSSGSSGRKSGSGGRHRPSAGSTSSSDDKPPAVAPTVEDKPEVKPDVTPADDKPADVVPPIKAPPRRDPGILDRPSQNKKPS